MNNVLTPQALRMQSLPFVGTANVGERYCSNAFRPAFYDVATRRAELSRFADGRPAPIHVLEGLPELWVVKRDIQGRVSAIKATVIAGFTRGGFFYTREQAAAATQH